MYAESLREISSDSMKLHRLIDLKVEYWHGTRGITLCFIILELLPFVFVCSDYNVHLLIVTIQSSQVNRSHSGEMKGRKTITLCFMILELLPFFKLFFLSRHIFNSIKLSQVDRLCK